MEICHYNDYFGHYDQYKWIPEVLFHEMAQQSSITIPTNIITTTIATFTTTTISNQSKHPLKRSKLRLNPEKSRSINIINNDDLNHNGDNNYNYLYHFYDPIYDLNDYQHLPAKYFSVDHFNPLIFQTSQQRNAIKWSDHCRKQNFLNGSLDYCKLISTETQPISSHNFYPLDLLSENSEKLKTNRSFDCLLHHKNIPFYIWDSMLQQKKDESFHSGQRQRFATMTDTCSCFNHLNDENDSNDDDDDDGDGIGNESGQVDDEDGIGNESGQVDDEDGDVDVVVETDSILSEDQHFNKSKTSWYNGSKNLNKDDNNHQRITTHYEESKFDRAKFMASAAEKLLTANRNMKEAQRYSISHSRIGRTRSLFNLFFPRKLLSTEISSPVLISSTKSTEYLRYLPDVQSVDNGLNNVRIFVEI